MLKTRQGAFFDRRGHPSARVTTLTYDFPDGYVIPRHYHDRDQLVYASQGVMTVRTEEGTWVVPTQRAVWIPARIPHGITMSGAVSMRTLYLKPSLVQALPRSCCVVNVTLLLRELILHACKFPRLNSKVPLQAHLLDFLVDQLETVRAIPLQLPSPRDSRAVRVAQALLNDPGDQRPLEELCKTAGASKRTVERLFQLETSMSFGKWRQQLRLMHAMRLLAGGENITTAALEAGYSTPSAFISMFKRMLGASPHRYFKNPL
ncbi:MAG: helix-turn-helix transcriptional regulator [Acidobacteriia bacterium]|nr:helix-turn-helix transcriptional regulator [Terriglobia bacterium]